MPTIDDIKKEVRQRDGMVCTECGMPNSEHVRRYARALDVHRVVPSSEYSLEPGACVTLCKGCHGSKPKRDTGTKVSKPLGVQFYTDQETVDALNRYLASLPEHKRPKKRAVIEAGLHMLLQQEGFWPPAPGASK